MRWWVAGLSSLPHELIPEIAAFQLLASEAKIGRSHSRTPFTDVDLKSRELLPVWLPPDMIGGRLQLPGQGTMSSATSEASATLGQIARRAEFLEELISIDVATTTFTSGL